jgi:hypothetical protein
VGVRSGCAVHAADAARGHGRDFVTSVEDAKREAHGIRVPRRRRRRRRDCDRSERRTLKRRERSRSVESQRRPFLKCSRAGFVPEATGIRKRNVVRIEVETALTRDIPIIPVLLDGATMPSWRDLPKSLRAFADRNAAEVDGGRDFHRHMDRLIRAIDRIAGLDPQHHGTDATRAEPARDVVTRDTTRRIDRPAPTIRPAQPLAASKAQGLLC